MSQLRVWTLVKLLVNENRAVLGLDAEMLAAKACGELKRSREKNRRVRNWLRSLNGCFIIG